MNNKKAKKTNAEIKKEMIKFLDCTCGLVDPRPGKHGCGIAHRNCLVLATSKNDMPRATPLEFFHEGLTIYIFGEPGGKIANLKKNPQVSAAVYEQPMDHAKQQKSLQLFGTAELITLGSNSRLLRAKARKWNFYSVIENMMKKRAEGKPLPAKERRALREKLAGTIYLIKITPTQGILREYDTDLSSQKYVWTK